MYAALNNTMSPNRQSGLSIVELMVSLVISMAVMAGAMQVVVSSKKSFIDQDEISFIQTNSRFAMDLLGKDIRMAGYMGCASHRSVQTANSIDDSVGGYLSMHGLEGFDGELNVDDFPADIRDEAIVGTDAIMIRRAGGDNELDVESHNPASATIHLFGDHEYDPGSVLIIADASCRNVGLFQVSGPNSVPANHIVHNTGSVTSNCTKIIKGNFTCNASCGPVSCSGFGTATGEYGPGSKVMEFYSVTYYIAESDVIPGMRSLKRSTLNVDGLPVTTAEELAIGVEDMEILYGVDSSGDGNVDQFRKASEMDLDGDTFITDDEWDQVLTVKLALVFRSKDQVMEVATKKTMAGEDYEDKYLRQVINSTVKIRNRG